MQGIHRQIHTPPSFVRRAGCRTGRFQLLLHTIRCAPCGFSWVEYIRLHICFLTFLSVFFRIVALLCPGQFLLVGICIATGVVVYAYYAIGGCDPLKAGYIDNINQVCMVLISGYWWLIWPIKDDAEYLKMTETRVIYFYVAKINYVSVDKLAKINLF